MSSKSDFTDKVLSAFSKMKSEIGPESSEYDVRHRIIKYLVEGLLGYQGKDYQAEKNRTDIKLLDETHSLVLVVIETKKIAVDINENKWKDQAFGYSDAFTKFIVLTNGLQLKVWDKSQRDKPLIDLDFEAILSQKRLIPEKLTIVEKPQISSIWELSKENLWSEKKYQDFYVPEKVNITSSEGFQKLLEKLDFVMNQLLMGYALRTMDDYIQGFKQFKAEYTSLEKESEKVKGNNDLEIRYEREKRNLEEKNQRFINFRRGYDQWLRLSGREDNEESKEVFCKETIYVLLNKILLVRICEDKGLVAKKVSNNGIKMWRQFASHLKDSYKDLLDFAYKDTSQLYSHVYEKGLFDWYTEGDGELNKVLNKILYIFNHFDFGEVNRDILGKLYEKYLPKEERKRLGEFYTPDEVIDYILDAVGYTSDKEIEGKDLLDPACGSGGFLVRTMNRLMERYKVKGLGHREILTNVISHIYGFDINPFACHITEMNLLFQLIDLYQKAKTVDPNYQLPRFNIYQADSLEMPKEGLSKWQYPNSRIQKYIEEKEIIDKIKSKKFDFVVGNPPYVSLSMTIRRLTRERKFELAEYYRGLIGSYRRGFKTPFKNFDLYMLFLEKGLDWLVETGKLGYICSDQFMMAFYGKKLRSYLLEKSRIEHIVDFGDSGVFQDVTNYPCILILEKTEIKGEIKCAKVYAPMSNILSEIKSKLPLNSYETSSFSIFSVNQEKLSSQIWTLVPKGESKIIEKMKKISTHVLGKLCHFDSGIRTGKDPLFVVKLVRPIDDINCEVLPMGYRKQMKTFVVERQLLNPTLRGRDVRRWKISWNNVFVLFPHKEIEKGYIVLSEDEMKEKYSKSYKYLITHKTQLESRRHYGKTATELHGAWYAVMHPAKYVKEKIVSPRLTNQVNFALDKEGYSFLGGPGGLVGIIPHDTKLTSFLLSLLNSKLYDFYLKRSAQIKAGKYYQFGINNLENFPILIPTDTEETKKIAELTDEILRLSQKLSECRDIAADFSRLLENIETIKLNDFPSVMFNFSINKLVYIKRDKDIVYLNFVDNIKCKEEIVAKYTELSLKLLRDKLKKATDLKSEVGSLRIPKDRDNIEKVIKTYENLENEIKKIPKKIKHLEKEIDQRVYKLYDLSEEEIRIVEKSTAQTNV